MPVNQGVHYNIDRVSSFRGDPLEVSISGWCWSPEHRVQMLRLESETHSAPCLTDLERPDVAAHFQDQRASRSGFAGRVQTQYPPANIRLMAEVDGHEEVLAAISLPVYGQPQIYAGEIRTYADWLVFCEPALFSRPDELPPIGAPPDAPLVSIVLPVVDSPVYYAHRSIESVLRQRYPSWQLSVSCDVSTDRQLLKYLEARARADSRIQLLENDCGSDSAQLLNAGFTGAVGTYMLPLITGDELHPEALPELARFLERHPDTQLLYSDEDEIDDEGNRSRPRFKPAFDPELLVAFNYIGHPMAIRMDVLRRVGGYEAGFGEASNWDLLLRMSEAAEPASIRHLPKPLYHMRQACAAARPDTVSLQRVLDGRLRRTRRAGSVVDGLFPGSMRVAPGPVAGRRIAVLYRKDHGAYQLHAIRRTSTAKLAAYELGTDGIYRIGGSGPPVTGWDEVDGDVVVVVNEPLELLNHEFFEAMADCAQRQDCGLAGPLVLGSDGKVITAGLLQSASAGLVDPLSGSSFASHGYMGLGKTIRTVAAVTPHCFAVAKSRLREIVPAESIREGALAPLCGRLLGAAHEHGLKVLFSPYAVAVLSGLGQAVEFGDVPLGPDVPRINPNMEAFSASQAMFAAEVLP